MKIAQDENIKATDKEKYFIRPEKRDESRQINVIELIIKQFIEVENCRFSIQEEMTGNKTYE